MNKLRVIGGGLAGAEAAWQAANLGVSVELIEMRPKMQTPAHRSEHLAEIVCSNSLKTDQPGSAPHLLKEELRNGNSLIMESADRNSVPAGSALAVDREEFSKDVTEKVENHKNIQLIRKEVSEIPNEGITIIATGPLTSDALTQDIIKFTGDDQLYFYDAIAPIVAADSIDMKIAFRAARYGRGGDDYINCPFSKEQYETFYNELIEAKSVPLKRFEDTKYFEACLPLEETARRGIDTLRFACMKPKGLPDPKTNREPYAAVQLRQENQMADAYSLVGFQNHLRYPEQKRILRLIPGLEKCEVLQYGQIHRNTYINSPKILNEYLQATLRHDIFFAGQITGVEGYLESVGTGWLAGQNAARLLQNRPFLDPPSQSAIGALARYVSNAETKNFQPVNITFGLLEQPSVEIRKKYRRKRERHAIQVEMAIKEWNRWICENQDMTKGATK